MKTKHKNTLPPKNFILDADGVFTDGKFYYTAEGKYMKQYGPDDADALMLLKDKLSLHVVTGDNRGFSITKKRIEEDMKLPLSLVSTFERIEWIKERFDPAETIYMGDGIFDPLVFKHVAYSIAPMNAFPNTKKYADYITQANGAEGAVAEAVLHILDIFFQKPFDVFALDFTQGSGMWHTGGKLKNT